jgi:hypothetical protein
MKQIHLPSPVAGQHQPCRQPDAGLSVVSGSTGSVNLARGRVIQS